MNILIISLACLASLIAGIVDAIAGGGGIITLPTLILLGLPVDFALGTSKLISTSGTSLATSNFIKQKNYSKFVIKYNLLFTCIGAATGAFCASYVKEDILKPIVSFLIISMAIYLFFKPELGTSDREIKNQKLNFRLSLIGAFAIGFYDGIFGPGTGAFLTFMFVKLLGQNFVLANGNTKVLNLTSNVVALLIFIINRKIIWAIGIPMAFANMLGGYFGSHIAMKKGSKWVRWIFIIMAILVGAKQLV